MVMSRDPAVDPSEALAAVNDSTAGGGSLLVDCSDGAAEHLEREVGFIEGAEQRTVLEFLQDVGVNITGGQAGRGKVEGCVSGIWARREGNVPAVGKVFEELWAVEVGAKETLPSRYVEGRSW